MEAFAGASMRGLYHKVRHKIGKDSLNGKLVALEFLVVRITGFLGKLGLKQETEYVT